MKALVYEGPRKLRMRRVPEPEPDPGEVVVKVTHAGICGSELNGYLGHNAWRKPPLVMGHEFSGQVVALGARATEWNPALLMGQRVVVNPLLFCGRCRYCLAGQHNLCVKRELLGAHRPGGFAELVKCHAQMVHPLPSQLSSECAALTEPLANAIRTAQLGACHPSSKVLIVGLGPIGILCLQVIKAYGVSEIYAVDIVSERRVMAEHFKVRALDPQVEDVVDVINTSTGGVGVDLAIDAVGIAATRRQCIEAVMPGGRVVNIGLHEEESMLPMNLAVRKEVSIQGTFAYTPRNFLEALSWLAKGRIELAPWMIMTSLEQGPSWFERLISNPGPVAKVLLRPDKESG